MPYYEIRINQINNGNAVSASQNLDITGVHTSDVAYVEIWLADLDFGFERYLGDATLDTPGPGQWAFTINSNWLDHGTNYRIRAMDYWYDPLATASRTFSTIAIFFESEAQAQTAGKTGRAINKGRKKPIDAAKTKETKRKPNAPRANPPRKKAR